MGININIFNHEKININDDVFGIILQYPNKHGEICDYTSVINSAKQNECLVTFAADLLSLTILTPPKKLGADIVVGSSQRFGIPLGYGGPHAAYFATHDKFKRNVPGRIIGVSHDLNGKKAYRMALQTREQHIRREKATSNICTSQVFSSISEATWPRPTSLTGSSGSSSSSSGPTSGSIRSSSRRRSGPRSSPSAAAAS